MKKSHQNYPNFLLHQKNPAAEQKQVQLTKKWRAFYHWCISQTNHGPTRPPH